MRCKRIKVSSEEEPVQIYHPQPIRLLPSINHIEELFKMTWEIEVSEPWYSLIKEGRKTTEGRKNTEKWSGIERGDVIIFTNNEGGDKEKRKVKARVVEIVRYLGPNALENYLKGETLKCALPGVKTYEEGKSVYLKFWNNEEIEKYGMLAIRIKLLQP